MGALRASTRRKNGYWNRQKARTSTNLSNKLERHILENPNDTVAEKALNNLHNRLR